jgi:glycosyltransferase involved in cell wall biosynthesis
LAVILRAEKFRMLEIFPKETGGSGLRGIANAKSHPLVSVILPTFNRPHFFAEALASVLGQTYRNTQIIAVNDGGQDVSDIIGSYNDSRIVFINRRGNRGKAYSLNEALGRAEGKYVCYLDDDDLYYPNHVEVLVNALESETECQVAYSDLYKAYFKLVPPHRRLILSKVIEVSRDFDRFVMLYFNHVLHVSLMHHRDLLEKTGPYNEGLNVLIDWDMTRRLAFFTDFRHVYEITGEFYSTVGESDRISYQQRQDQKNYARNVLAIRTSRPSKPWSKLEDLSVIFVSTVLNKEAGRTLGLIWRYTFYPYEIYLPLTESDLARLDSEIPNMIGVAVGAGSTEAQRVDAVLAVCKGDYVAIVPSGFNVDELWVEDALYALINSGRENEAYELRGSNERLWAVVIKKSALERARKAFGNLALPESLLAAGISIRRLQPGQIPFELDQLLDKGRRAEREGKYSEAGEIFEDIADRYANELWMKGLAAEAYFKAGNFAKAVALSSELNQQRATVDTLLLEAKLRRRDKDFVSALRLLGRAEEILEGTEPTWMLEKKALISR